jgi:hypothetical protein
MHTYTHTHVHTHTHTLIHTHTHTHTGGCGQTYRDTPPHAGYAILQRWFERLRDKREAGQTKSEAIGHTKNVADAGSEGINNNGTNPKSFVEKLVVDGVIDTSKNCDANGDADGGEGGIAAPFDFASGFKTDGGLAKNGTRGVEAVAQNIVESNAEHGVDSSTENVSVSPSHPGFIYTSNVDGHFQRAGFDPAHIYELHGCCEQWQCSGVPKPNSANLTNPSPAGVAAPCSRDSFAAPTMAIDPKTLRTHG